MSAADAAQRLFASLAAHGTDFTKYLQPGLPAARIADLAASLETPLPPDVIDFYRHFDLPKAYAYNPDQPRLYGLYWLLGLEDAVASWQERRSYDFLDPVEHTWLPFLQEDGNCYLVDMIAAPDGHHRIIRTFYGLEPQVEFLNLTAMFGTFDAWLRDGVLPIEDGHVAGDYEGDPRRVAEIALRLNPGVDHWAARLAGK